MEEDKPPRSSRHIREEQPSPKEQDKTHNTRLSAQEDNDQHPFLSLPIDAHKLIFSNLDPISQKRFAYVSKATLELAALFTFGHFYNALPLGLRSKIGEDGKSINEKYECFQRSSDAEVLETLYIQSLLLEAHSLLSGLPQRSYAPIRVALLHNLCLTSGEEIAKQRTMADFCLNEQDEEEGEWRKAYILHALFWEGYKHPKVMEWLVKKKFYLAQIYESMSRLSSEQTEEYRQTNPKHIEECPQARITPSILQTIASLQEQLVQSAIYLEELFSRLPSLARSYAALYHLELQERFDDLISSPHTFIAEEEKSESFSSPKLAKESAGESHDNEMETACFFLRRSLLEPETKKQINALAQEENYTEIESLLFNLLLNAYGPSLDSFYESRLVNLWEKLLESKSTVYILMWQRQLPFLAELSEDNLASLYRRAQTAYKEKFGRVHPQRFSCTLGLNSQPLSNELGLFYEEDSDTYAKEAEIRWAPVVDLGDAKVAFELAKTWAHSEEEGTEERAAYWFSRYQELAPDLPFGGLEDSASEIEDFVEDSDSETDD